MAKEEDAFENDIFSGFGKDIEPGHVITDLTGKLRYRQGGDYNDWSNCGGTKYLPRNWFMQCGAAKDIFVAASFGGFEVNYPEPFGDSPIFLCNVIATLPVFTEITGLICATANPSTMEVYWWSAANITRIYINWLAIGPVGFN